jgi:hypothetical protein
VGSRFILDVPERKNERTTSAMSVDPTSMSFDICESNILFATVPNEDLITEIYRLASLRHLVYDLRHCDIREREE